MELLQDAEFLPQAFKLDHQCLSLVTSDVADAIGVKYGRLSLRAKTIFNIEQVKVEIACHKMLTTHSCCYINELESKLKYIKGLEEIQLKEANILMPIWKQQ